MLSVPATGDFLLGRDMKRFRSANSIDPGYLFHEEDKLSPGSEDADITYDVAELTQCGRRGDALKLALGWVYHGRIGYERYVDNAFDMAVSLANMVKPHPHMETAAAPHSVQVCFYYMPSKAIDGNEHAQAAKRNTEISASISERLPSRGFMVDYAPGPVGKFLRVVTNGHTKKETMDYMVSAIDEIGLSLIMSAQP